MNRFRVLYGAGPLNFLVLLFSFAIAGLAVMGWFQRPRDVETILLWFGAAIVLHDLLFVPLYTLLDQIAFRWLPRWLVHGTRSKTVMGAVNATPYLRIPAILSGVLLLVFFPVIFGLGAQSELSASGIPEKGYLARWLIASGVIFAVSGLAWRVAAARRRPRRLHGAAAAGPARTVADGLAAPPGDAAARVDAAARPPTPDHMAGTGDAAPTPAENAAPSDDAALPPAPD